MKILLDSWAWLELLAGKNSKIKNSVKRADAVLTSAINYYEVLAKIERDSPELVERIRSLMINKSKIIPINGEIAEKAVKLRLEFGLHAADALTFASAKTSNAKLLTGDPHFKKIRKGVIYCGEK